jgi:hypothetical protein
MRTHSENFANNHKLMNPISRRENAPSLTTSLHNIV